MYSTKDFLFDQSKFLSSRKLSFAGEAGKTRQVIYISFSPPDPVSRMNVPPTAGTAGAIPPANKGQQKAKISDTNHLGQNSHPRSVSVYVMWKFS